MEKLATGKESYLDKVERGLKELDATMAGGIAIVGPSIGTCSPIDQEYSRVVLHVAPRKHPLLTLKELQEFAGRVVEKTGPATEVHETIADSYGVDLPRFRYQDVVAVRSEDICLKISDRRAKEVLRIPEKDVPVEGELRLERCVDIKRNTLVIVCPSKEVAEFAHEHYRESLSRNELAKYLPKFRCGDSCFEGLSIALTLACRHLG